MPKAQHTHTIHTTYNNNARIPLETHIWGCALMMLARMLPPIHDRCFRFSMSLGVDTFITACMVPAAHVR